MPEQQIRAVVWDLGGVILRTEDWGPRERWESELGLPSGELHQQVFEGELGVQAALGLATPEEIWHVIGEKYALPPEQLAKMREDFWSGDHIDETLTSLIRSLRPAYLTGLLSNAWPSVRPLLEGAWALADAFDVIVLSCEVGLVKPDPRIYHLALDALRVDAGQVVFVDDFERNVAAARALGMYAIHFQNPDQTRGELSRILGW